MDSRRKIIEMFFHWWCHRVQPMHGADEIVERFPGGTFSIRKGRMVRPLLTARSTSFGICPDELALEEKTSTMIFAACIASMIPSPYDVPGTTSRGAIQHRMAADSSRAHTASATVLSFEE